MQNLRLSLLAALISIHVFHAPAAYADDGFHDESEAGVVITSGNTRANSFNFKQKNSYGWATHALKLDGAFLDSSTFGTETARSYNLGLRLEERITDKLAAYLGQNLESDLFAGYLQRYNSDVGAKYIVLKEDGLAWNAEAGYRYTVENRVAGDQTLKSFLRLFTEGTKDINKNVSARVAIEYLPNLSSLSDYRINSELSLSALLNEVFSIKTGYVIKYINQPLPGVAVTTDTIFTTALVAKL